MHQSGENEEELLLALKKGQAAAFDALVKAYSQRLSYFTYKIVDDRPEANSIVDDTFMKAWRFRGEFKHFSELRAFLYVCCRNEGIDYLRRKNSGEGKIFVPVDDWGAVEEAEAAEETRAQQMALTELLGKMYEAISILTPSEKKVIMRVLKGMKLKEIAFELGQAYQSVRNTKQKAIQKLRLELGGNGESPGEA